MLRITENNIFEIIRMGENETVEMKMRVPPGFDLTGSNPGAKAVLKAISAFANAEGGSIIFGCKEGHPEERCAFFPPDVEKLIRLSEKEPYKNICQVYTVAPKDRMFAVVDVKKSETPILVDGIPYIRRGDMIFIHTDAIRPTEQMEEFTQEIIYRNRVPQKTTLLAWLDQKHTNPERIIPAGKRLYRCRIIDDMNEVGKEEGFKGYGKQGSFVPPAEKTRDMRANYCYIPYLYCASHENTAMREVRPSKGVPVSVATIVAKEDLRLLDFTKGCEAPGNMKDAVSMKKRELFTYLSLLYSKPLAPGGYKEYIPTQFIAEYVKKLGYDGIAFTSSLTPVKEDNSRDDDAYNTVVFHYEKCEPTSSAIVYAPELF